MPAFTFRQKLSVLAVACAYAPAALAQTADDSDNALPEVVVTSASTDGVARRASIGSFPETSLLQTPASVNVITQEQMQDRSIRSATDAVKWDASVQNSYNAVGLADWFAIRGFVLDQGANYRKDGMVILAQARVPMENKERIEILKGLAGLQAGIAASGGMLNYVTKRPTDAPLRSATFEVRERGTVYGAVDLGGRSEDGVFGYRINAAAEDIKSYVDGSTGNRNFISGAFDFRLSERALLQLDLDYQHKSQLTVPGFQLLGPEQHIPTGIRAKQMLNDQSWSRPVVDDSYNLGVKFDYALNDDWRTILQANQSTLHRDDGVTLPSGCQAQGLIVGYCSDGGYSMYDLRRKNDKRSITTTQALLQGNFTTGGVRHELTTGVSTLNRRDHFADYVFNYVGESNIYNPVYYDNFALADVNPVHLRRKDEERAIFVQDVMALTDQLRLHAGVRYVQLKRDQFNASGETTRRTDDDFVLPSVALLYNLQPSLAVYGSYSQGLEPGGTAPTGTTNAEIIMDPSRSRQLELGVKADVTRDVSLSAAVFQIKRNHEYVDATPTYVINGTQVNRGLEFAAQGRVTRDWILGASFTALQAKAEGTDDARIEGKQVGNVPRFKSAVYSEYAWPGLPALKLNATWLYSSSKNFAPNNEIAALNRKVEGYHVLNLGARYTAKLGNTATTFRAGVDNVFNKFYWGDASSAFGGYLIPGAPRVFRVSAQIDF
ncbi:TonB-dependent siderophore receptor [Methylobacillus flagellatus]|uniref:TonB-dependent siderophore receptor n=1 Tax=Methylobacillus flagellatus TaxID=405 RepID=UPI002853C069|nr:TonB-dependent siderophore receptor [Methylobacillus flagellatus]MDR5172612.1 TonB-dependent siderophore receptor [Methylobacillus flagellatus]